MSDTKALPRWKGVRSNKPRREGEAFVLRDNTFVLKVYKQDAIPDTLRFAHWLADQFNKLEEKKEASRLEEQERNYVLGGCTESNCTLCNLEPCARKPGMHHAGLSPYQVGTKP